MTLLTTWYRHGMYAAAKRFVLGGSGASWVFGTCFEGVLLSPVIYVVVLELSVVVLARVERVAELSATGTWQSRWETRGVEQGSGGQDGAS
jgi:hypothetical protein